MDIGFVVLGFIAGFGGGAVAMAIVLGDVFGIWDRR